MQGKVRIIGGEWRGRKLQVIDKKGLRPTPDRIRETLFNWLAWQIPNSRCLDLFAGSGALGFEAASRGAKQVVLVEQDKEVAKQLQQHKIQFNAENIFIYQKDALHFLQQSATSFDIVFLDPPFAQNLLTQCCQQLETYRWLNNSAHVYLECEQNQFSTLILPEYWRVIRRTQAGQVVSLLVKRDVESDKDSI